MHELIQFVDKHNEGIALLLVAEMLVVLLIAAALVTAWETRR